MLFWHNNIMKTTSNLDYKRIFRDIIEIKHPEKREECQGILSKKELSTMDIIKLNQRIFDVKTKENYSFNQRHRSYSKGSILEILDYQKKNKLNNSELSLHFNLSRNTIAKWKRIFSI